MGKSLSPSSFRETATVSKRLTADDFVQSEQSEFRTAKRKTHIENLEFLPSAADDCDQKNAASPFEVTFKTALAESPIPATRRSRVAEGETTNFEEMELYSYIYCHVQQPARRPRLLGITTFPARLWGRQTIQQENSIPKSNL
jgi:hypothetical protein